MFAPIARLIDRWKRRHGPQSVQVLADRHGVNLVLDGGTVSHQFPWAEVAQIRTFKRDLGTVDDIRLVFQVGDSWYEYSEDLPGFGQLSDVMKEIFPTIPCDWYMEVMRPPFATNERVLFRRADREREGDQA
jgi:hypothetical protein